MESVDLLFQEVHVGVEEDEGEGDAEVEQEPDVYSLDVGGGGKLLTHLPPTHTLLECQKIYQKYPNSYVDKV